MMTKVEEVARAIYGRCNQWDYDGNLPPYDELSEGNKAQWVDAAVGAIEAMKGLPDSLAEAVAFGNYTEFSYGGDENSFEYFSADNAKAVWDDLIDAALSHEGK
jgi:hypothetical protein